MTGEISQETLEIPPRSGVAFKLSRGQRLRVIDPNGKQVSDLMAYSSSDLHEALSSGRSVDYASSVVFTTGKVLYSNKSNPMLRIVADTCGKHDFMFTPCSRDTFLRKYPDQEPHRGCHGNFVAALEPFGIDESHVTIPFNIFMNVEIDPTSGAVQVLPPTSVPGDYIEFAAEMDLIVALTACSAPRSNAGVCKPIQYQIITS